MPNQSQKTTTTVENKQKMSTVPQSQPTALPAATAVAAGGGAATTATSTPSQPSSPDAKKVGSDGEDFSDTANETGTFEVRSFHPTIQQNQNMNTIASEIQTCNCIQLIEWVDEWC